MEVPPDEGSADGRWLHYDTIDALTGFLAQFRLPDRPSTPVCAVLSGGPGSGLTTVARVATESIKAAATHSHVAISVDGRSGHVDLATGAATGGEHDVLERLGLWAGWVSAVISPIWPKVAMGVDLVEATASLASGYQPTRSDGNPSGQAEASPDYRAAFELMATLPSDTSTLTIVLGEASRPGASRTHLRVLRCLLLAAQHTSLPVAVVAVLPSSAPELGLLPRGAVAFPLGGLPIARVRAWAGVSVEQAEAIHSLTSGKGGQIGALCARAASVGGLIETTAEAYEQLVRSRVLAWVLFDVLDALGDDSPVEVRGGVVEDVTSSLREVLGFLQRLGGESTLDAIQALWAVSDAPSLAKILERLARSPHPSVFLREPNVVRCSPLVVDALATSGAGNSHQIPELNPVARTPEDVALERHVDAILQGLIPFSPGACAGASGAKRWDLEARLRAYEASQSHAVGTEIVLDIRDYLEQWPSIDPSIRYAFVAAQMSFIEKLDSAGLPLSVYEVAVRSLQGILALHPEALNLLSDCLLHRDEQSSSPFWPSNDLCKLLLEHRPDNRSKVIGNFAISNLSTKPALSLRCALVSAQLVANHHGPNLANSIRVVANCLHKLSEQGSANWELPDSATESQVRTAKERGFALVHAIACSDLDSHEHSFGDFLEESVTSLKNGDLRTARHAAFRAMVRADDDENRFLSALSLSIAADLAGNKLDLTSRTSANYVGALLSGVERLRPADEVGWWWWIANRAVGISDQERDLLKVVSFAIAATGGPITFPLPLTIVEPEMSVPRDPGGPLRVTIGNHPSVEVSARSRDFFFSVVTDMPRATLSTVMRSYADSRYAPGIGTGCELHTAQRVRQEVQQWLDGCGDMLMLELANPQTFAQLIADLRDDNEERPLLKGWWVVD